MSDRQRAVVGGLGAIAKSLLLIAGVPATLVTLWSLAPAVRHPIDVSALETEAGWVHLLIVAVAMLWAWASISLLRDLVEAVRTHDGARDGAWSHRWAGAIVGLILTITAGSAAATTATVFGGRQHIAARTPVVADRPRVPGSNVSAADTVKVGECLSDLAERLTGERGSWTAIARANLGSPQSGGGRFVDPNLVLPGWCVAIPETVASSTNISVVGGANTAGRIAELATLGLGVLGTGAVAQRLRSLRRLNDSGRLVGSRAGSVEPPLADVSAAIDPFADSLLVDWIDAALRIAGTWHDTGGEVAPDLRLIRAGPSGVELLLATPAPVCPNPMTTIDGGRWWVLDAEAIDDPASLAPGSGRLVPWVIPVGGDGDSVMLVAVGPGHHLAIDGTPAARTAALRGIVAALRALPWASELDTELIGIDAPPPTERCYHLFGSTVATLRHLVLRPPVPARVAVHPSWRREPLVVLSATADESPDDPLAASLLEVCGVISDRGSGTETLVLDDAGSALLAPYGIELTIPQPTEAQSALLDALFASTVESVPLSTRAERPAPLPPVEATPSWPGLVDIALFDRRPAVRGLSHPPSERDLDRLVELLAFLALHQRHSTVESIGRALYSRERPATVEQRVANLFSLARSVLPRPKGTPLLAVSGDEVTLDPSVTLDWDRISSAIALARLVDPAKAMASLRQAFDELGQASILDDTSTYGWFRAEGLSSSIRGELLDGAHHLATLAFATDDLDLAGRAIARGLEIDPIAEILVRDAMVLNDRAGALDLAIETYRGFERALESLADAEPSSETRALFDAMIDPTR